MDSANNLNLTGFAGGARLGTKSTVTLSGQLTSGSSLRLGGGNGNLTVSSIVGGSRNVDVADGRVILTGANTFTDGVVVNYGGILQVSEDTNLGAASGAITLNYGGQLEMAGSFTNSRSVSAGGHIDTQSYDLGLDGAVTGTGGLGKSGSGTLTLNNANYTGNTSVQNGTLKISGSSVLFSNSYVHVGGTLDLDGESQTIRGLDGYGHVDMESGSASADLTIRAGSDTYDGSISGGGKVTISDGANQAFYGNSTYTGGTVVDDATLRVDSSASLGAESGSLTLKDGGSLIVRGNLTSSRQVLLQDGNNTITANKALYDDSSDPGRIAAFSGTISGNGNLVKMGSETLKLSGSVNHTGTTEVNAGILDIASGGVVASSDINVAAGATLNLSGKLNGAVDTVVSGRLQGSGRSYGSVVVTDGGVLAPGNSPGKLTVGDLTLEAGGIYEWELQDADAGLGVGWDYLLATGDIDIGSLNADPFIIKMITLGGSGEAGVVADWNANKNYTWTLMRGTSWSGNDVLDSIELDYSGINNALNGTLDLAFTGTYLQVKYTTDAIPEPGTMGLMGLSTLALLFRRRRMKRCMLTGAVSRDPFGLDAQSSRDKRGVEYMNPIIPRMTQKARARAQWLNY